MCLVCLCVCVCVEGRCLTGWKDTEVVVGIILGVSEEDRAGSIYSERDCSLVSKEECSHPGPAMLGG